MKLTRQELQELLQVQYKYLCPSNFEHFKRGLKEKGYNLISMEGKGAHALYEIEPESIINLPEEEWKNFPLDPGYQVSSMGRIKNPQGIILPGYEHRGYVRTRIGKLGQLANHRAVMLTFKPIENPELFVVDHINGIRNDNRLENLRWVFQSDNNKYKDENYSAINEILAMIIHKYGYDKAKEKLINLLSDDISIG